MAGHFGTPETHGEFFSVRFSTKLAREGMNPDFWLRLCCNREAGHFLKRMEPRGCWQVLLRHLKRKKNFYELRLEEPMEA